jgi:hypothetical protein
MIHLNDAKTFEKNAGKAVNKTGDCFFLTFMGFSLKKRQLSRLSFRQ